MAQFTTWAAFAVRNIAPGELIVNPKNARKHPRRQIAKLAAVIAEFGFTNPILIDEINAIIAGHGRLEAAKRLKLATVPTIRLPGLSVSQKAALAIADNRLGDMSQWDMELLTATMIELEGVDYDVELTGFDAGAVDMMLGGSVVATDPADMLPSKDETVVSRLGDVWHLDGHRLLCGDALDPTSYEKLLGGALAQMVFTDPPYNVPINGHVSGLGRNQHREFAMASGEMSSPQFTQFLTTVAELLTRSSTDGSLHHICMDWRHLPELLAAGNKAYAQQIALCVWDKQTGGMGSLYRSQHELILVFKHGTAAHINNVELGRHGRHRTNVWSYPGLSGFGRGRDEALAGHPTVKPIALVAEAIRDCSKRNGLVLDPFSGSGTTIMAAERTSRRAVAIEIDPRYVDLAIRRWQTATSRPATLADGRTFTDVASERSASGLEAGK